MQLPIRFRAVHGSKTLHVKVTDMFLHVHSTLCKTQRVLHSRVSVFNFFSFFCRKARVPVYKRKGNGDHTTFLKVGQRIEFIGSGKYSGSAAPLFLSLNQFQVNIMETAF